MTDGDLGGNASLELSDRNSRRSRHDQRLDSQSGRKILPADNS